MNVDQPLSLRQAQYFVAVAAEGSFTRAAETLRIAQPSLSHQVRALEAAVGTPLLERTTRSVSLTPAGRALLPAAQSALDVLARGRRAARAAAQLEAGELRVATTQSLAQGVLPRVLSAWRREHPRVEVSVSEHTHIRDLHDELLGGGADLALAQHPDAWQGPIEAIGEEELVVVVAEDDPLAPRRTIALSALAERRWVLPDRANGLSETVELACAQAGFVPRAAVRSSSIAAVVQLAIAGLGPALVPANVLPAPLIGRVIRPRPRLRRPLAVFALAAGAHLLEQFAETARRHGEIDPPTRSQSGGSLASVRPPAGATEGAGAGESVRRRSGSGRDRTAMPTAPRAG